MQFLGKHIILELHKCNPDILKEPDQVKDIMEAAANVMGATIVISTFHHFSPLGVSGVVVIKESHLTIHTWPEHQYAAIDIFTCGHLHFEKGIDLLVSKLEAKESSRKTFSRGKLGNQGSHS